MEATKEVDSSANITGEGGSLLFAAVSFSLTEESVVPVNCSNFPGSFIVGFLNLSFHAWVFFSKPLLRWCLLHEGPTFEAALISFLKGIDYGAYLPLPALPFATKSCFCACFSFLYSLQDMTEEVHRALWVS